MDTHGLASDSENKRARLFRCAFSIAEFCDAHRISRSKLYQMFREGTGPRVMRIGTRCLISIEAAEEWRRAVEAQAALKMFDLDAKSE